MGFSQIVPDADFSAVREALKDYNIPPRVYGKKHLFFAEKFNLTTHALIDACGTANPTTGVAPSDLYSTSEFPALTLEPVMETAALMGGKPSVRWNAAATTKPLKGRIDVPEDAFTVHIVYALPTGYATGTDSRLFVFTGDDGKGITLRPTGPGPAIIYNINGSTTFPTATVPAANTQYIVSFTFNKTTKELKHYVSGALVNTFTAVDFTNLVGTLYVGAYINGGAPFKGLLGGITIYNWDFTLAQIAEYHTFLANAF